MAHHAKCGKALLVALAAIEAANAIIQPIYELLKHLPREIYQCY